MVAFVIVTTGSMRWIWWLYRAAILNRFRDLIGGFAERRFVFMENKISVITPVYHGRAYLDKLRVVLENCALQSPDIKIEWILSNDDPDDRLDGSIVSNILNVKILDTDTHRGIQGARVHGLKASNAKYVLFLDQDDYIKPRYFISQLKNIKDADAVVCDLLRDGKMFYDTTLRPSLDVCVTRQYNISQSWGFFPGQVLIKRSAIPNVWIDNWLVNNCCDDYLLWICMFSNGCKFVANHDVLYEHVLTGRNQSGNSMTWMKSTFEMISFVKRFNILSDKDESIFINARMHELEESIDNHSWTVRKLTMCREILQSYEQDIRLSDVLDSLSKNAYVAIYGSDIGMHLYNKLDAEGVKLCFVDFNAHKKTFPAPAYTREEIPPEVTIIINTLTKDEKIVNRYIQEVYPEKKIIHILDLLDQALHSSE